MPQNMVEPIKSEVFDKWNIHSDKQYNLATLTTNASGVGTGFEYMNKGQSIQVTHKFKNKKMHDLAYPASTDVLPTTYSPYLY